MSKFKLPIVMAERGCHKMKEVAAEADLKPTTVSGVFHGNIKRTDVDTLDKLCSALDCQVGDLLEYVPGGEGKVAEGSRKNEG